MSKTYIVKVGYNYFGVASKEEAFTLLNAIPLTTNYVDGDNIYTPKEGEEITLHIVDSSKVRSMTKEEAENKALREAQSSLSYYKGEAANKSKEIEELKCQIKMLTKKEESE